MSNSQIEDESSKTFGVFDLFKIISKAHLTLVFVRLLIIGFSIITVTFSLCANNNALLIILIIVPILTIALETCYILIKRKGKDFSVYNFIFL
jgi:hypothetical protein